MDSVPTSRTRPVGRFTALVLASLVVLAGCSGADEESNAGATSNSEVTASASTPAPATSAPEPQERTQKETCDWDAPAKSSAAKAPTGHDGELAKVIVGAWQHTHISKDGAGFKPVESEDIRYVFPSAKRLLYCQHVPGITDHRSNAADITWDGNRIVPPGGAPGFTVTAWSDEALVWTNNLDKSRYLLQRR